MEDRIVLFLIGASIVMFFAWMAGFNFDERSSETAIIFIFALAGGLQFSIIPRRFIDFLKNTKTL